MQVSDVIIQLSWGGGGGLEYLEFSRAYNVGRPFA